MATLYIVATPIGNLEDITLRALRTLGEVAHVYAEDTRRTRTLLDRHEIAARPRSLHAHNEALRTDEVVAHLDAGEDVALVSDAGTPLVSDPGERLVAAVAEAGHAVVPLPGASAVMAALMASGLLATPFTFVGFVPRKAGERGAAFSDWAGRAETVVMFESPKRLSRTLAELAESFGAERPACVARELTKMHEEFARGSLGSLADRFAAAPRGEITLIVSGAPPQIQTAEALRPRVEAMLAAGASGRDIAASLHAETGVARREIYSLTLELQTGRD